MAVDRDTGKRLFQITEEFPPAFVWERPIHMIEADQLTTQGRHIEGEAIRIIPINIHHLGHLLRPLIFHISPCHGVGIDTENINFRSSAQDPGSTHENDEQAETDHTKHEQA